GRVSKGEITEFDFAARLGALQDFRVAIIDTGLGRKNVIQPAHGSRATLKNICHPSKGNHGPDEHGEVSVESNQRPQGNLAAEELMAALPEHDQKGCANERLKRRHKHAPGADEADVSRDVLAVGPVKAADFCFFLRVGAHEAY